MNFKMLYTQTTKRIFMNITLHLYQAIHSPYRLLLKIKLPKLFKTNQCVQVALSNNKPEVCISQARKRQNCSLNGSVGQ